MKRNTFREKIRILGLVLSAAALFVSFSYSLAWYYNKTSVDVAKIDGAVTYLAHYFESGNGTVITQDPEATNSAFEIKYPDQFYNLAWLQYMGYFNRPDQENSTNVSPTYFYLSADLDMSGYVLPPIGTQANPFVGNFDGNGHTITGLTVANTEAELVDIPLAVELNGIAVEGMDIVGVFGVVGEIKGEMTGTADENGVVTTASGYTYSSLTNEIRDVYLDQVTVQTQTGQSLIGIAAGYVNGTISKVGVINSSVEIVRSDVASLNMTENLSDYSLVGYCEEPYLDTVDVETVDIAEPAVDNPDTFLADNAGDSWGGSIAMDALYTRLSGIYTNKTSILKARAATQETVFIDLDGSKTVTENASTETTGFLNYTAPDAASGVVTFSQYDATDSEHRFRYLYGGEITNLSKVVTSTTRYYSNETVYYISNGSYYLGTNQSAVTAPAERGTAVGWYFSNGTSGTMAAYIDDTPYYLNANGTSLTIGDSGTTEWQMENESIYYVNNGIYYYLVCNDGTWTLVTGVYQITDGTNYLSAENSGVINRTDASAGTAWRLIENGSGYRIAAILGNNTYYLNKSGTGLSVGTSSGNSTIWYYNRTNQTLYCEENGINYHLIYLNNAWGLQESTAVLISCNGNYLNISGSSLTGGTEESEATRWIRETSGSGYRIVAEINNTTYYLNRNGTTGVTLGTATDSATVWSYTSNSLYVDVNNLSYCLSYVDEVWILEEAVYRISDGNGHYLNASTSGVEVGTADDATYWRISSENVISTQIGGQTYYLGYSPSWGRPTELTISTSQTNWSRSGNAFYVRPWAQSYYIYYNNNSWTVGTSNTSLTLTAAGSIPIRTEPASNSLPPLYLNMMQTLTESAIEQVVLIRTETETVNSSVPDTYIPLTTQQNNTLLVDENNTGYITSGYSYHNSGYPYRSGDVRVSQYAMSDISTALGQSTYSDARLEVLTQSADSGDLRRVSDSYNASNRTVSTSLNAYTKMSVSALGLEKYEDARTELSGMFSGQSNIYGLHFMDATISMKNLFTAKAVTINRQTYENYQLPRDCIDFTLKEAGRINFFAGTYFTNQNNSSNNNNSFFSLHQIFRDENQNITAIKEISKIYDNEDGTYLYQFVGGTWSDGASHSDESSLKLAFDLDWIKTPTIVLNAVYYYEIPANEGEYALGSVEGRIGAYLFYLDISANAQTVEREITTELTTRTVDTYQFPKGVDFLAGVPADKETEIANSAAIALTTGAAQKVTFTRTDNGDADDVIAFSARDGTTASFVRDRVVVHSVSDANETEVAAIPISTTTNWYKQITIVDVNLTTEVKQKAIFTVTETQTDGGEKTHTETVVNPVSEQGFADTAITQELTQIYDTATGTLLEPWSTINTGAAVISFRYTLPLDTTVTLESICSTENKNYILTLGSNHPLSIKVLTVDGYGASLNETTMVSGGRIEISATP